MHRKQKCRDRQTLGEKHQATHRGGEETGLGGVGGGGRWRGRGMSCSVPGKCGTSSHEDLVGN